MKKFYLMIFAIATLAGMLAISGCKKKDTYMVTFNPNGGTGTMEVQTFTEGEAQALTRNAFTYDGYTFTGWNTVQGGSGASYTDGQTITATADMILYAQWTSNGTNPLPSPSPTPGPTPPNTLNGHEFVDLGLPSGTKWATCNVGSTTPEGYGDYFAWGETTPKDSYTEENYTYSDNPETLPASADADAATANWGEGWRMPTQSEMQELYDNCTHEWTTQNEVNGRLFTGPNGNSIFLPAAGGRNGSNFNGAGSSGIYLSSSLYSSNTHSAAWNLYFNSGSYGIGHLVCSMGLTVRAVCQSQN